MQSQNRVGSKQKSTVVITDELVNKYAAVTGDDNPLHLDEEYASETMFEERIAHGMLPMGIVSSTLAEFEGTIVYLSQDAQFLNPISIGSEVEVCCTILKQLDDNKYKVETSVCDADTAQEYISGTAVILIQ